MKLCVIGSSHCGALVDAWRQISGNWPDVSLTFFAAPRGSIRQLAVRDGKLVAMTDDVRDILKVTSGGLEACDPNQYDRFLFYGLISQPYPRQSDIDYSVAVREAALKDRGSRSPAVKLAGQLRTVTGKPVDVAAAPFKVPVPGVPAAQWSCPHQAETAYLQGALFDGLDASLIAQPDSTVIEGTRSTFPEYAKGSKRLQIDAESEPEQHPSGEVTHMNAQYGQIWLEHYLPMAVS